MSELGSFQSAFSRVLHAPGAPDNAFVSAPLSRGITVHRNTVVKGLVDALADNYPTLERLAGREWFAACAIGYIQEQPPGVPMLALYGTGFAEFLARHAAAAEFPYLPEVARIDRLWTEAHFASDAPPLAGDELARRAPADLLEQRLMLHPATRFGWFRHSAVTIWMHNRPPAAVAAELEVDGMAEGVLLTRPQGAVESVRLDLADHAFLARVSEGATLGEAATSVLERHPDADFATLLARLIAAGAFEQAGSRPTGALR